jgi:hypothetical protein
MQIPIYDPCNYSSLPLLFCIKACKCISVGQQQISDPAEQTKKRSSKKNYKISEKARNSENSRQITKPRF